MTRKEEIDARKVEIRKEIESADNVAQVEKLEAEVDALNEERKQIERHKEDAVTSKKITEERANVIEREEKNMKMQKN